MNNIEAVLFDLDDTILNRAEMFSMYCDYFLNTLFPRGKSADEKQAAKEYMIWNDKNGYENRNVFYKKVIDHLGLAYTVEQLLTMWEMNYFKFATREEYLIEILDYLAPNYRLGIVTNGASSTQNRKIDAMGIRDFFRTIVISADVGMSKPETGIFLLACANLGVSASSAVFVGDNYEKDIMGATRAGLSAIWMNKAKNKEMCKTTDGEMSKATGGEMSKATGGEMSKATDNEIRKATDNEMCKATDGEMDEAHFDRQIQNLSELKNYL